MNRGRHSERSAKGAKPVIQSEPLDDARGWLRELRNHHRDRRGLSIGMTAIPRLRARFACATLGMTLVLVACDRANQRDRETTAGNNGEALAATPKAVKQAPAYTVRALDSFGAVSGSVEIDGPLPADSVIQTPVSDQPVCIPTLIRRGIEHRGARAVGVVVWIDGIRSGKPLPIERRFEVTNEDCSLDPELQAAVAGGTLNVRNRDATEHRTRVTRRGGGEVVATIRETDEGQVVPNDQVLAKAGILELSCDAHPWTRSWIAVFDHPYFAVTDASGSFVMDSIPPGRYAVRIWHPRLGTVNDSVTVEANQRADLTLRPRAG